MNATVKRLDELDTANGGRFALVGAGLGVGAFGINLHELGPNYEDYPEHDHMHDGQEEVFTALDGSATLTVDGTDIPLEPGVFVRVAPEGRRKLRTGAEPAQVLAIGATAGA